MQLHKELKSNPKQLTVTKVSQVYVAQKKAMMKKRCEIKSGVDWGIYSLEKMS